MNHLLAPLFTVLQAPPQGWGLIALVPLLWAPLTRWRHELGLSRRLIWAMVLPLPWVLLAYWTSMNWAPAGAYGRILPLAGPFALAALISTLLSSIASAVLNRDTRLFFVGWGLVNTWFAAIGALLCLMATSGDWI